MAGWSKCAISEGALVRTPPRFFFTAIPMKFMTISRAQLGAANPSGFRDDRALEEFDDVLNDARAHHTTIVVPMNLYSIASNNCVVLVPHEQSPR